MDNKIEYSTEYLLRQALEKIANPITYMQKEAERNGMQIDGIMAVQIANDHNWLKQQAKNALADIEYKEYLAKEKADKETQGWEDQREAMFNAWKDKEDKKHNNE